MDVIEALVARTPGAVFAVDKDLRVVAWNANAEEGLAITASEALGRPCYEVVPAVDAGTGRPCHEQCPLVQGSAGPGWAHNRTLSAPWSGGRRTRLDCFLLKCLLSTSQRTNLCFVGPPTTSGMEAHSRILEATEAIFPVVTGAADIQKAITVFLATVLHATAADAAELFLLDPETGKLVLMEHQGAPTETVREFCQSAVGEGFSELISRSHVPLLAAGSWPHDDSSEATGWYLCVPLVAEDRVLGALGIASYRREFDIAATVRVLFPVAVQISTYLRWAYLVDDGQHRDGGDDRSFQETARLKIYCLGAFRVLLDGEPVPMERFNRFKKALTLLKYLAAHRGRPVPRETLMELLWSEAEPTRASGNLRVVLHALRRSLEPKAQQGNISSFVLSKGDLVYLDPSDRVWVDVEQFVQSLRRANEMASQGSSESALVEYQRAASLYKGDYMEDELYSDWCLLEREHLKETYLSALRQMAFILVEQSEIEDAINAYRTALEIDPGREEVHRQLIRLLWQVGRRDEAIRQYDTCRRILREEIGVRPSQETEALYEAMHA